MCREKNFIILLRNSRDGVGVGMGWWAIADRSVGLKKKCVICFRAKNNFLKKSCHGVSIINRKNIENDYKVR